MRVAPPGPLRREAANRAWPVRRALRTQKAEALLLAHATMKSWIWNPKLSRVPFEGCSLLPPAGPVGRDDWPDLLSKHLEDIYATPDAEVRNTERLLDSWSLEASRLRLGSVGHLERLCCVAAALFERSPPSRPS